MSADFDHLRRRAQFLYCTRSSSMSAKNCGEIEGYPRREWCPSCRVLDALPARPPRQPGSHGYTKPERKCRT